MRDPKEAPGSWLQIGSSPTIVAALGVNHQMEDLPLCLSSSLYISLSNKIEQIFKKLKIKTSKNKKDSLRVTPNWLRFHSAHLWNKRIKA